MRRHLSLDTDSTSARVSFATMTTTETEPDGWTIGQSKFQRIPFCVFLALQAAIPLKEEG